MLKPCFIIPNQYQYGTQKDAQKKMLKPPTDVHADSATSLANLPMVLTFSSPIPALKG